MTGLRDKCPNCGAEVLTDPQDGVPICPLCASHLSVWETPTRD